MIRMLYKKSQLVIGSQITILFSLVAGAFILIFFFTLGRSAKSSADTEMNYNMILEMKEILDNSRVSMNTLQYAKMPKELEFKNNCEGFYLENLPKINNDYIFAPDALKGMLFYLYSSQIEMPFYIDDILLISSEKINNLFLGDSGNIFLNEFLNSSQEISYPQFLNSVISQEIILDEDSFKKKISKNDIETRFIYFNSDVNYLEMINQSLKNLNVNRYEGDFYFIFIDSQSYDELSISKSDDQIDGVNHVSYFYYNKNSEKFISRGDVYTYGRTFLHAAINSDSQESYDCKIDQIQDDYSRISKLYLSKTEQIIEGLDTLNTNSEPYYKSINQSLNNLLINFNGTIDHKKANSINREIENIENMQVYLLKSSESLPLIY